MLKWLVNSFFILSLFIFAACTDYVSQIEDRYGEWNDWEVTELVEVSSSSISQKSSSSVFLSSSSIGNPSSSDAKLLLADQAYIIYSNGLVSDIQGTIIGSFDSITGTVWGVDGTPIVTNIDINQLPKYDPDAFSTLSSSSNVTELAEESLTDSRDGQSYRTVTIGAQTWMAQNLNYETANSYCYNDNASNCSKYGRLYTWAAAMDSAGVWSMNGKGCGYGSTCTLVSPVRGVCPSGWHLPNRDEWNALLVAVGGASNAGLKLKSVSDWYGSGNGSDDFDFSALAGGFRNSPESYFDNGNFLNMGDVASFWYSEVFGKNEAFIMELSYYKSYATITDTGKNTARSVRCVKD